MSLESRLIKELTTASVPVSVEYLAKKLHIGWGTTVRYCLELLVAGKICGIKTTNSWIFWINKNHNKVAADDKKGRAITQENCDDLQK